MGNGKFLKKIENRLDLINKELKSGFNIDDLNSLVIEDVLGEHLPILNSFIGVNNFEDVISLEKASKRIFDVVTGIREDLELKNFLKNNRSFDKNKLRELYVKKNLFDKFPNFNIEKYFELLDNPPMEYKNYAGKVVRFNIFWVKKMIIAINQMIFNEMDLYILNIGKEGAGKSAWSSQQILWFFNFLDSVGLIDYAMNIKRMFFADVMSFLNEHETQGINDYFRIECLDEANELNRSNFREEGIQQFKYEMRTERKQLRIILLNMQQLGELDTSISLSRVNFIYDCKMSGDRITGTLNKGFGDMYIIPRDDYIFSEKYKKVFSRNDILNAFANKLDNKKKYYTGLPREFMVADFTFGDVWGFDKEEYDNYVKSETKGHKFNKSIKMTTLQAYIIYSNFLDFKRFRIFDEGNLIKYVIKNKDKLDERKLKKYFDKNVSKLFDITNNRKDKKMYDVLTKFFNKLEIHFDENPEKVIGLEKFYGRIYNEGVKYED